RAFQKLSGPLDSRIHDMQSSPKGISLKAVAELAQQLGMNYQAAWRKPGSAVPVPCVIHWKSGHYAALVKAENGRYLAQDPTFGKDIWVSQKAIDDEGSGYFLVESAPLSAGWRTVPAAEAQGIWGKGPVGTNDLDSTTPQDLMSGGTSG